MSHVWGPLQRPEEGVWSPGAGVTGGGDMGAVNKTQISGRAGSSLNQLSHISSLYNIFF